MNSLTRTLLTTVFSAFFTGAALAHSNEYLDSIPSPHGGQVRMSGPYHMELMINTPGELNVYLTDHGNVPQMTAGAEAMAKVKNGKRVVEVKLTPGGENTLKGKGEFVMNAKTGVVIFLKMPGQEAEGFQFAPLKPKTKAGKGATHQCGGGMRDGHTDH